MQQPTFKQQFDKLTTAYIENKVEPWEPCGCFVGNLLNGHEAWTYGRKYSNFSPLLLEGINYHIGLQCVLEQSKGLYTMEDICRIEKAFMTPLKQGLKAYQGITHVPSLIEALEYEQTAGYEETLFTAFSNALDVLREIHLAKGEVIEETSTFKPRNKQKHETAHL